MSWYGLRLLHLLWIIYLYTHSCFIKGVASSTFACGYYKIDNIEFVLLITYVIYPYIYTVNHKYLCYNIQVNNMVFKQNQHMKKLDFV